jgi:TonB C terminal
LRYSPIPNALVRNAATMDSPQKLDVVEWENSPLPTVPKTKVRRRFLPPTLIGILGTLLLHAIFIQSISFGSRRLNQQLPDTQDSANLRQKAQQDSESLVLLALSTNAKQDQNYTQNVVSSLPNLSKMKIKSQIDIDLPEFRGLESLALSEDEAPNALADSDNSGEQTRFFGIYTGQIQARIDRVWRRPRTPVNEANLDATESFQCEAQIIQDGRGNVQEILLPRCNGSSAWQRSLVLAIQQASPLPAPPSEKVFRSSISLEFVGMNYVAGAPEDDYEITGKNLLSAKQNNGALSAAPMRRACDPVDTTKKLVCHLLNQTLTQ